MAQCDVVPGRFVEGYARILAEVSRTGRRLGRDELQARRALGVVAAREGVGLRELVRAHLAATRAVWPELPGMTGSAAVSVLAAVEQAVDALAEGYERAQLVAVRRDEAARREFIDDLLHGRSDPGRLSARAERFGLYLAGSHAVAVARGPEAYDDTHPVTRRAADAVGGRFRQRQVLLATKDGRLVCIAPGNQPEILEYFATQARQGLPPEGPGRVALGRAHAGPGGIVQSYEEALSALELSDRVGKGASVVRVADLLVFPVLTRDRQAMAELVRTVLGPLAAARGGPVPSLRTLGVLRCGVRRRGGGASAVAERAGGDVPAGAYPRPHWADLADPMQRYTLQTAVFGARLLDWPTQGL